jgi:CRP-like cAMP-binding protein
MRGISNRDCLFIYRKQFRVKFARRLQRNGNIKLLLWGQKMQEPVDFREFARALGTVVRFGPGDIVFRESDPPSCMDIVLTGRVEITAQDKVIETISESRALGILSLLDGQPRTITARVTEPSELALMDQKRFRYMVEEVPNFVWYVMTELAGRLRATNAAL